MNEETQDPEGDPNTFIAIDCTIPNSADNVCSSLDWFWTDSYELNDIINVIVTKANIGGTGKATEKK